MPGLSAAGEALETTPAAPGPRRASRGLILDVLLDVALVLGTFALLGVAGALLWQRLTVLATYTRTSDDAVLSPVQYARQINPDGWFFVIALAGGALAGVALTLLRWRRPILLVLLLAAGGLLASTVMVHLGLALGPPDPRAVLEKVAAGTSVPMRLEVTATGVTLMWPVGALLGAMAMLGFSGARTRGASVS